MTDLIARIEALDGPDREVDALIKAAVYGGVALQSPFNGEWCLYVDGTIDPRGGKLLAQPRGVDWHNDRYTGSIDAAMTLVLEGYAATVTAFTNGAGKAVVWIGSYNEIMRASDGTEGATPALALCAEALRARGVE